eukprot:CFRG0423T1
MEEIRTTRSANGTVYTTPLKRFNVVKKRTVEIFKELESVIISSDQLLRDVLDNSSITSASLSSSRNSEEKNGIDGGNGNGQGAGLLSSLVPSILGGSRGNSPASLYSEKKPTQHEQHLAGTGWVTKEMLVTLSDMHRTVLESLPIIERDTMKVVFVGHTSNGKSTTINAMLYSKLMPASFGHTTNAFISVRGTSGKPYIMLSDGTEKRDLSSSESLGQALSDLTRAGSDDNGVLASEVVVYWDKVKCRLLEHDITIIDTPGLDLAENYDRWLDTYCFDADVFVLVANAEATLKHTEMSFLQRINKRVANPNLFILYNRWDAADDAEDEDKVKEQHLARAHDLLVNELCACGEQDWHRFVYFVSAREAFAIRSGKAKYNQNEEMKKRYDSFNDFEKVFEGKVSDSAIRTKFDNNVNRGKQMLDVVMGVVGSLNEKLETHSKARSNQVTSMLDTVMKVERFQSLLAKTCRDLIAKLVVDERTACDNVLTSWLCFDFPEFVEGFDYASFHKGDDPDKLLYRQRLAEMTVDNLLDTLGSSTSKALVLNLVVMLEDVKRTMQMNLPAEIFAMVEGHVGLALQDTTGKHGFNTMVVNDLGRVKGGRRSTVSGVSSQSQSRSYPTTIMEDVFGESGEEASISQGVTPETSTNVNENDISVLSPISEEDTAPQKDDKQRELPKTTSVILPVNLHRRPREDKFTPPGILLRGKFLQFGVDFTPDLGFHFSLVNGRSSGVREDVDNLRRRTSTLSSRVVRGRADDQGSGALASTSVAVAVPATAAGIMYRREGTDGLMKSGAMAIGFAGALAAWEYGSYNYAMQEQRLKEQWIDHVMNYFHYHKDEIIAPIVTYFVMQAELYAATVTKLLQDQLSSMREALESTMSTNENLKEIADGSAKVIRDCEKLKRRMTELASEISHNDFE